MLKIVQNTRTETTEFAPGERGATLRYLAESAEILEALGRRLECSPAALFEIRAARTALTRVRGALLLEWVAANSWSINEQENFNGTD